ncbi:MAG: DUF4388 domain-containing protein [Blastocatellia bacterium]|nr:DUF4388 domain-containing protein [Blastocatellia bacterium]
MSNELEKIAVDNGLVDVELYLKYRMPERAVALLQDLLNQFPTSFELRWRLAEIYLDQRAPQKAAEQMVALANIYVMTKQFDLARSALLKVQEIYPKAPQINNWLESLNQWEHDQSLIPNSNQSSNNVTGKLQTGRSKSVLSGNLQYISLFDIVQTIEKNSITGVIHVTCNDINGTIYFNKGLIADAIIADLRGKPAFKRFAEITDGEFELEPSPIEFQSSMGTTSNAQLILEIFSDEETETAQDETVKTDNIY